MAIRYNKYWIRLLWLTCWFGNISYSRIHCICNHGNMWMCSPERRFNHRDCHCNYESYPQEFTFIHLYTYIHLHLQLKLLNPNHCSQLVPVNRENKCILKQLFVNVVLDWVFTPGGNSPKSWSPMLENWLKYWPRNKDFFYNFTPRNANFFGRKIRKKHKFQNIFFL